MLNENAKKWVEALRSGRFSKLRFGLRKNDSYCALGVLCELYRIENGGRWETSESGFGIFGGSNTGLPDEVRSWAGLTDSNGRYQDGSVMHSNDSMDQSFAEIADIIEFEPEGLFANSQ